MKAGHYPINICSVTAPTLLSVVISILPERYRQAGNPSTSAYWPLLQGEERRTSIRAVPCQGKGQAAGEAAERCLIRPSQHSQVLPVMQEPCSGPTRKVCALSMFHCRAPPVQVPMVLLLLQSDSAARTCPRAHTAPTDPSLIPRNSMYSLNTGWQQGWCRALLALGSSGGGGSRVRILSWFPGCQGGPGRVCSPVPHSLRGSSRAAKSKGKTTIGTALLCPWLCPPESSGNRRNNRRNTFFFSFFPGESQSWQWESKSYWERVLWACSGDWFRTFLSQNLKPFLQAQIDLVCSSG